MSTEERLDRLRTAPPKTKCRYVAVPEKTGFHRGDSVGGWRFWQYFPKNGKLLEQWMRSELFESAQGHSQKLHRDYLARNPEIIERDKARFKLKEADQARRAKRREYRARPEVAFRSKVQSQQWKSSHRDHIRELHRIYRTTHKGVVNYNNNKRFHLLREGKFSEKYNAELVRCFYDQASRVTCCTGIPHHVDHVIPIARGGMHVQTNLQVVTAAYNIKKGSKPLFERVAIA